MARNKIKIRCINSFIYKGTEQYFKDREYYGFWYAWYNDIYLGVYMDNRYCHYFSSQEIKKYFEIMYDDNDKE